MKNGRMEFFAQVKSRFFWWWIDISYSGEEVSYESSSGTRAGAQKKIDLHKVGNSIKCSSEIL